MRKNSSGYTWLLAIFSSALLCLPGEVAAAPDTAPRAGEISRVIPAVSIARGTKSITASAKTVVDWQDVVSTQANARARVALDDGSVLNVGSSSSIKVVKHDGGAQQTELEVAYGKLRTTAQKITKPDGKFEVKTPAGVAGVVGTDFYVAFDNSTGTMNVTVFEGLVKVCNLAGVCVIVKAGQTTNVRTNDSSGPQPPTQAALDTLVADGNDTNPGDGAVTQHGEGLHIAKGEGITLGIVAVAIAVVVGVAVAGGHGSNPAPPAGQPGCIPAKGC